MPNDLPSPEMVFAVMVLLALVAFRFLRWLQKEATSPDPWDKEVEEAVRRDDALPLCPHCLAPQEQETWFCAECGNSIGAYNNLNPYLFAFSVGDLFRNGTTGWARPRPLVTVGFLLLLPWAYFVWVQPYSVVLVAVGLACWALFWILFFSELGGAAAGAQPPGRIRPPS